MGRPYITSAVYDAALYIEGGHRGWTSSGTSWSQVDREPRRAGRQTVWFRWLYLSASSVTGEGYSLNNVELTGGTPVSCGPPPGPVQSLTVTSATART